MAERKIFNYPSDILVEDTEKVFGYHPDKYADGSAKFVIARCRYCGKSMKIRKCFYKKANNSACHKECRLEEQKKQVSPFLDEEVRKKSKESIMERYGVEHASQNKSIGEKIAKSKTIPKEIALSPYVDQYGYKRVIVHLIYTDAWIVTDPPPEPRGMSSRFVEGEGAHDVNIAKSVYEKRYPGVSIKILDEK